MILVFTALIGVVLSSNCVALEQDRFPNVVVILADDLGYGDLGCYGATRVPTPNIDKLAAQGCRFTDAYAPASVCTPSRYNLLTGRYAWRTWAKSGTVWANDPILIEPDRFTLADLFKQQGYSTAIIGKWHLGFGVPGAEGWSDVVGPDFNKALKPGPLELGFDYFWGIPHVGQLPHVIVENHHVLGLDPEDPIRMIADERPGFELDYLNRPRLGLAADMKVEGGHAARYEQDQLAIAITEHAIGYLKEHADGDPFFLYVAHRNIHAPIIPDPRWNGKSTIGRYGDFLLELDWSVGEILNTIDELNLNDDTIVIFTSDNGGIVKYEPLDFPDIEGHFPNAPLRGQKTGVFEGGIRVPLIVRWPGEVPPGSKNNSLIALTDFLATFADYFVINIPSEAAEDSFSALSSLLNHPSTAPQRTTMINDSYTGMMSIRQGDWKLILGQHGGGASKNPIPNDPELPQGQLFNLREDITESNNLYDQYPDRVEQLTKLLHKIRTQGTSHGIE